MYSSLFIPNCTRNHMITYTKLNYNLDASIAFTREVFVMNISFPSYWKLELITVTNVFPLRLDRFEREGKWCEQEPEVKAHQLKQYCHLWALLLTVPVNASHASHMTLLAISASFISTYQREFLSGRKDEINWEQVMRLTLRAMRDWQRKVGLNIF